MLKLTLTAVIAIVTVASFSADASAQDWRQPNSNQPNGYHASEFNSHYHGNLHAPAQPLNGYHASEARSHYGGSRFEPSNGWNEQSNNGPGSAFSNASIPGGGMGSAYSNASWYQNGGSQNTLIDRMRRSNRWQGTYQHLAAAGYVPGGEQPNTTYGASQPGLQGFRNRLATFKPLIEREQGWRQREIQSVENGQGGFNTIYAEH